MRGSYGNCECSIRQYFLRSAVQANRLLGNPPFCLVCGHKFLEWMHFPVRTEKDGRTIGESVSFHHLKLPPIDDVPVPFARTRVADQSGADDNQGSPFHSRDGVPKRDTHFPLNNDFHIIIPLGKHVAALSGDPVALRTLKTEYAARYLEKIGAAATPRNIALLLKHFPFEQCSLRETFEVGAAGDERGNALRVQPRAAEKDATGKGRDALRFLASLRPTLGRDAERVRDAPVAYDATGDDPSADWLDPPQATTRARPVSPRKPTHEPPTTAPSQPPKPAVDRDPPSPSVDGVAAVMAVVSGTSSPSAAVRVVPSFEECRGRMLYPFCLPPRYHPDRTPRSGTVRTVRPADSGTAPPRLTGHPGDAYGTHTAPLRDSAPTQHSQVSSTHRSEVPSEAPEVPLVARLFAPPRAAAPAPAHGAQRMRAGRHPPAAGAAAVPGAPGGLPHGDALSVLVDGSARTTPRGAAPPRVDDPAARHSARLAGAQEGRAAPIGQAGPAAIIASTRRGTVRGGAGAPAAAAGAGAVPAAAAASAAPAAGQTAPAAACDHPMIDPSTSAERTTQARLRKQRIETAGPSAPMVGHAGASELPSHLMETVEQLAAVEIRSPPPIDSTTVRELAMVFAAQFPFATLWRHRPELDDIVGYTRDMLTCEPFCAAVARMAVWSYWALVAPPSVPHPVPYGVAMEFVAVVEDFLGVMAAPRRSLGASAVAVPALVMGARVLVESSMKACYPHYSALRDAAAVRLRVDALITIIVDPTGFATRIAVIATTPSAQRLARSRKQPAPLPSTYVTPLLRAALGRDAIAKETRGWLRRDERLSSQSDPSFQWRDALAFLTPEARARLVEVLVNKKFNTSLASAERDAVRAALGARSDDPPTIPSLPLLPPTTSGEGSESQLN